ncbi:MAG: DUF2798 domain-containing protein [Mangrovicoccus sp.]
MPPSKTTVILAQFLIAAMMAFLMTGIFTALPSHFAPGWVSQWLSRFAVAFPIAFTLSLGIGPLAFWLAAQITRRFETPRYQSVGE